MEEPAVLADWEQLYEIDVSRKLCSQLGKRKVEKYLSLADTIEMATDLELHANFLLDEALSRNSKAGNLSLENADRVSRPPNRSLPDSQQKISDNADQYHQFNNINGNANAVDPKSDITRTYSDHNHNEKRGNSTRRKDLGHNSKDRKKEPFTFTSAKSVFVDEGGTFSHRKEDYKIIGNGSLSNKKSEESSLPQELAGLDKAIVEKIESEIIIHGQPVRFDDISGLEFAKQCVIESVCWPILNPHLFQGLRSIPRGILLFGPPGTGKTLIGKAIANQSGATFFSISASSLMSKWIGEGEKTVKALFAIATYRQPAVVFIDEIDSLLCQRSADENEATRRMKTEFLVQLDGAGTDLDARVVIVGATNRPEELDEAVRRRFVKRLYIPLPDEESRSQLFGNLLGNVKHELSEEQISNLVDRTKGYSGADIKSLCTEAAMGPLRELARNCRGQMESISASEVPSIKVDHFESALKTVQPSVSTGDLKRYLDWNTLFGSYRLVEDA